MDIALECARMQHRFTMPPLEVEDFPQVGISELKIMPQPNNSGSSVHHHHGSCRNNETTDILQEILSVAHASQELNNQTSSYSQTWGGNINNAPNQEVDDFTFMVGRDGGNNYNYNSNIVSDLSSMRCIDNDKTWEDPNAIRSIDIGDLDEEFKAERMVENLRWVGMSSKYMEKVCPKSPY